MNSYLLSGIAALLSAVTTVALAADAPADSDTQMAALLQHDYLNLESQSVKSTSLGWVVESESLSVVALYTQHDLASPLSYGYPERYQTIDMLLDGKHGEYQYLGIFKSESDQPVSGGLSTYQIGVAAGVEMSQTPNMSFILGGGFAIGDFGIETSDGDIWPVIPVPLVRINYATEVIEAKFEFLTSPNLSFTLYPQERVRVTGDMRMDQLRDGRDFIYEFSLMYRFFEADSEYGDLAGVAIGIKNDGLGEFVIGGEQGDETLELHYNSLFATLDLSLIKLTAGYAFNGRELYRGTDKVNIGDGAYFSIQGVIPL